MSTIILAILVFFVLHQANEGIARIRWPGPLVLAAAQIGQVRIVLRHYRPRRVYFQFSYGGT